MTATQARAAPTPPGVETARLAASGLGDKEIADRLYPSRRSVENRLHSVYAKLGCRRPGELGAALEP